MNAISSFFSWTSEAPKQEPETSITFKVIPEREDYFQVLPDEILEKIFKLISGQTRLEILPKVCYQFYLVSREFSGKCYHLHHLIPLAYNSLNFPSSDDDKNVHILHFKENQKLSVYNMEFESEELSIIKSYMSYLKQKNNDTFDILTFHDNLWRLIVQKAPDEHCPRIQHHLISNQHSKYPHLCYRYPAMLNESENDSIAIFYNYLLEEETLEELADILIIHGQKSLLNYFDEDAFVQDFTSLFNKTYAEAFLILVEKAKYNLAEDLANDILLYAQLPFEKCVKKLKNHIKIRFRAFNSKCSYKNSLILVFEAVRTYTYSKKLFYNYMTPKLISEEFFLHQINPPSELTEELQWFADKLISLTKK